MLKGMIQITITYLCSRCESANIVKNGHNKCGNQQYHCNDCKAYRVLEPKKKYSIPQKQTVLKTYKERASLRGLERIFEVTRQTVARWIIELVQSLQDIKDTLVLAKSDDVLELDEMWSFVLKKSQKRWLWTAMCRRTRQIVAFVIGDRSKKTCLKLWLKIPEAYRHCHTFSDFWESYQLVFPEETHQSVGKESGETAHMERFYCTFRQRMARFVRKTLSFSKSDAFHHMSIKWFIHDYNLDMASLTF